MSGDQELPYKVGTSRGPRNDLPQDNPETDNVNLDSARVPNAARNASRQKAKETSEFMFTILAIEATDRYIRQLQATVEYWDRQFRELSEQAAQTRQCAQDMFDEADAMEDLLDSTDAEDLTGTQRQWLLDYLERRGADRSAMSALDVSVLVNQARHEISAQRQDATETAAQAEMLQQEANSARHNRDQAQTRLNELTAIKENSALSPDEKAELSNAALEGTNWQELDAVSREAVDHQATGENGIVVDRRLADECASVEADATRRPNMLM